MDLQNKSHVKALHSLQSKCVYEIVRLEREKQDNEGKLVIYTHVFWPGFIHWS